MEKEKGEEAYFVGSLTDARDMSPPSEASIHIHSHISLFATDAPTNVPSLSGATAGLLLLAVRDSLRSSSLPPPPSPLPSYAEAKTIPQTTHDTYCLLGRGTTDRSGA